MADNGVIGSANRLPWRIPEDLKRFRQLTTGHAVIMGRKTFESIGKPLPDRKNIVISQTTPAPDDNSMVVVRSLQEALQAAQDDKVFIIGGDSVYRQAMPLVQRLHVTHVHAAIDGDAFFPEISEKDWVQATRSVAMVCSTSGLTFTFATYLRREST